MLAVLQRLRHARRLPCIWPVGLAPGREHAARSVSSASPEAVACGDGGQAWGAVGLTPEQQEFQGAAGRGRGAAHDPGITAFARARLSTAGAPPESHTPRNPSPHPHTHPHSLNPPAALAAAFAREHLAPHSAEWDDKGHFPVDTLRRAAGLGFGGLYTPEELGGAGLSRSGGCGYRGTGAWAGAWEARALGGARHRLAACPPPASAHCALPASTPSHHHHPPSGHPTPSYSPPTPTIPRRRGDI